MSCNSFLSRLAALSEPAQIRLLEGLSEERLLQIERACAPPECDCPIQFLPCQLGHTDEECDCLGRECLPCPHMKQDVLKRDTLTWLHWTLHPELYQEPTALPERRSKCMIRESLARIRAERAAAGQCIYHPEDYVPPRYGISNMRWDPQQVLGIERELSTRETNPAAPANGSAVVQVGKHLVVVGKPKHRRLADKQARRPKV